MIITLDWLKKHDAMTRFVTWLTEHYPDGGEIDDVITALSDGHMEWVGWIVYRTNWTGAIAGTDTDGSRIEVCYHNGFRHRENGPAYTCVDVDGTRTEMYYLNNLLYRKNGPAYIRVEADGSRVEEYYLNDLLHRKHGPAYTRVEADGTCVEKYYLNDRRIMEGVKHV